MQAIIPAAGLGRRLKDLTEDRAKCMIEINGVSLIERMLVQLDKLNLSRIVIIVGHQDKKLIEFINSLNIVSQIVFIKNPIYDKTNNIYSLYLAKDYLKQEDTIILESDLIFEDAVLEELVNDERDTLALVDKYENWMDGTVIKIDNCDSITDIISGNKVNYLETDYYKTVNIYKFSQNFSATYYVPFLEAYLQALGCNQYYEQVLRIITILDEPIIKAKRLNGQPWYEIDNIQDMDIASILFEPDSSIKLKLMEERYGGYWRYPKLLDFCYLVNPFFPPQRMLNEIKSNFQRLISTYPSGLKVNSLLAAKSFGVKPEHIIVGNGATELIKALAERLEGNVGIVYPTFDEYPNRYYKDKIIPFMPENSNYIYTADHVISYFSNKDICSIVIINPDNPTGNYIRKDDMLRLIEWAYQKRIRIIIDESFADFSDEYPNTLIDESIIQRFENLVVIKSISKSYGIPGLRLGVLVSYDEELLKILRKDVSIWNINSFAEFYMQIEEKYRADYESSLVLMRKTREKYVADLKKINGLKIIPSQANFVTAEILATIKSKELAEILLSKYNFLIKDLSSKTGFEGKQFIRIAIRTEEDNFRLVSALNEILDGIVEQVKPMIRH